MIIVEFTSLEPWVIRADLIQVILVIWIVKELGGVRWEVHLYWEVHLQIGTNVNFTRRLLRLTLQILNKVSVLECLMIAMIHQKML